MEMKQEALYKDNALYWCDTGGAYHEVERVNPTQIRRLDDIGQKTGRPFRSTKLWTGKSLNFREEMRRREQERRRERAQTLDGKLRRIIFVCRACKHHWAHDYTIRVRSVPSGVRFDLYRTGEKEFVTPSHDGRSCLQCQSRRITINEVRGTYNPEKKCDGRCRNATGPHCDCSCGGAYHGENHLVG